MSSIGWAGNKLKIEVSERWSGAWAGVKQARAQSAGAEREGSLKSVAWHLASLTDDTGR